MSYIEAKSVEKHYDIYTGGFFNRTKKTIKALDGVNLSVEKGDMLGYIGPNGAGKSTTIKILTGILTPSSGEVSVAGFCPHKNRKEYVKHIGAVFGQRTQMWWDLPVIESYRLLRDIFKVEDKKYKNQLEYLVENLDISKFLNQPVRQLSLGQRMRAELAACMIHDPEILFLDEPTIGLDVVSKHKLMDFLKELNTNGKTIFITTHDLKDLETLSKEMMILNNGKVVYKGNTDKLNSLVNLPTKVSAYINKDKYNLVNNLIDEFSGSFNQNSGEIILNVSKEKGKGEAVKRLLSELMVEDFKIEEPNIEDIVKDLFKDDAVAKSNISKAI